KRKNFFSLRWCYHRGNEAWGRGRLPDLPGKRTMAMKKRAPRGPGRLSAEQTAELPNRLLDAALLLFTEHGYAQTTMEQIARKAGASTKTIYSRYSNKDEILQAVVRRSVDAIRRPAAETISAHAHDIEPQDFLSGLGRQIVTTISGEGAGLNRIL